MNVILFRYIASNFWMEVFKNLVLAFGDFWTISFETLFPKMPHSFQNFCKYG